jgi:hypothetical protein
MTHRGCEDIFFTKQCRKRSYLSILSSNTMDTWINKVVLIILLEEIISLCRKIKDIYIISQITNNLRDIGCAYERYLSFGR